MKQCTKCQQWLPLSEFYKRGPSRTGEQEYRNECRSCKAPTCTLKTPCAACQAITECRSLLRTDSPLPCSDPQFKLPASKAWPDSPDDAIERWRQETFVEGARV